MEEDEVAATVTLPVSPEGLTGDPKGPPSAADMEDGVLVIANGDIQYEERSIVDPGGGKVLEMCCTTQTNTENGVLTETYSSRLCENVKLENGEVVRDKQYEESAIKTSTEKKESGEEKVDTSRLHYEENERVRDTKAGNKLKEFCATKEEKQEVSSTELDPTYEGPNKKYLKRSRNSFSKSSVKHQSLLDDSASDTDPELLALRDSLINSHAPGSYVSKALAATKDKALETYSATSSRCDYSEKNPGTEDESGSDAEGLFRPRRTVGQAGGDHQKLAYHTGGPGSSSSSCSRDLAMTAGADESSAATASTSGSVDGLENHSYSVKSSKLSTSSMEEVDTETSGAREIRENGVSMSMSESSSRASSAHAQADDDLTGEAVTAIKSSRATSDSGISVSGKIAPVDLLAEQRAARADPDRIRKSSPPFEGPYAFAEDRRSADELIKRILADSNLEPSPRPTRRYKVDMGSRGDAASYTTEESSEFDDSSASGSFVERPLSAERRHGDGRPSLLERRLENLSKDKKSTYSQEHRENTSSSKENRYYSREEEMNHSPHSLHDNEGEVFLNEETIYMKKLPKPKREEEDGEVFLNEETIYMKKKKKSTSDQGTDEFASEVRAMKDKYKEGQEDQDMEYAPSFDRQGVLQQQKPQRSFEDRYQDLLQSDSLSDVTRARRTQYGTEEEDMYSSYSSRNQQRYVDDQDLTSAYSMQNSASYAQDEEEMGMVPYRPRGRMMRQPYVDDDEDDVFSDTAPPPAEPVLPDEAFQPQRSSDTDQIVQERTQEIKRVVQQQGDVLKKLKEASDSFDDLSAEIKKMKQDFIERQVQRQITLDQVLRNDEEEDPYAIEYEPENKPVRYGGQLAITSGHEDSDYGASSYGQKYSYGGSSYRSSYSQGQGYGSYGSRYRTTQDNDEEQDDQSQETTFGTGLRSLASRGYGHEDYTTSTAYGYKRKNYMRGPRSKSLYDDPDLDDDSGSTRFDKDDDADSTASGYTSRRFGSHGATEDDDASSVSSYSRKYGSHRASQEDSASTASGYRRTYGGYGSTQDNSDSYTPKYSRARRYSLGSLNDDAASTASGDGGKDAEDETPSYRRSYRGSSVASNYSSSSYKPSYGSQLGSSHDSSSYSSYTPRSSRLRRSQTLSDFDSSRKYTSSFGSGVSDKPFTSRFLSKVREQKVSPQEGGEAAASKRDKPFKSRFLRSTFDSGSSSYSSSRYSSRSASVGDIGSSIASQTKKDKE